MCNPAGVRGLLSSPPQKSSSSDDDAKRTMLFPTRNTYEGSEPDANIAPLATPRNPRTNMLQNPDVTYDDVFYLDPNSRKDNRGDSAAITLGAAEVPETLSRNDTNESGMATPLPSRHPTPQPEGSSPKRFMVTPTSPQTSKLTPSDSPNNLLLRDARKSIEQVRMEVQNYITIACNKGNISLGGDKYNSVVAELVGFLTRNDEILTGVDTKDKFLEFINTRYITPEKQAQADSRKAAELAFREHERNNSATLERKNPKREAISQQQSPDKSPLEKLSEALTKEFMGSNLAVKDFFLNRVDLSFTQHLIEAYIIFLRNNGITKPEALNVVEQKYGNDTYKVQPFKKAVNERY